MSNDEPAVEGLHAVTGDDIAKTGKTTKDDAYREAFLRNTIKEMAKTIDIELDDEDQAQIICWLRTVWLEARGEEWGEGVEVGGGEAW